ncbi:DUF645 family protein [Vibrio mimicus]
MLLDVKYGQLSFTKDCNFIVSVLSWSRTLNRGQLNLDRFEFWSPTSQLWVLDVCLFDALA